MSRSQCVVCVRARASVCVFVMPGSAYSRQERLRKPRFPEERGRWQWTRFNVTKYITEA